MGALEKPLAADAESIRAFLTESIGSSFHLACITPDGAISYRHFGDDAEAATAWAVMENMRGRGVYWTVNQVRDGFHGKPSKKEIEAARFVHVDLDPPKDGSPWDRAAVLGRLEALPTVPSFVIDSGGGLGAFWRLEEESANLSAVEAINIGVRDMFGADHCWNIDRLMRLPGTVNWPNRKKIAAGRQPRVAAVLVEDEGAYHDPRALTATFPAKASAVPERGSVEANGLYSLLTADTLFLGHLDPLRSLIEHPSGGDRSADALACAGRMVRDGYTDAQIMGILMNPANAVHAHIGDQRDPRYQAMRCIEKARAPSPMMENRHSEPVASAPSFVSATPYTWRDPHLIPQREWIYGRSIQRGHLRAIVAPGAAGKTIFSIGEALAMVTGRDFLGQSVPGGPKRVWLWNLEDDLEELSRSIQAACKHWNITPADIDGRLYVDSALDGAVLKLATSTTADGFKINAPLVEALTDELIARQIDYLHVDPFVSSHAANESDNMEIDTIAKQWAVVAKRARMAIGLAHHVSKAGAAEVKAHSARGAVSLTDACRSVLTLNRMSEEEANRYGIEGERRRRFFRVYDDKNNRAPPSDASDWYTMLSVTLGNGDVDEGDNMGVVVPWSPPDAFDGVTADHLYRIQSIVAEGSYRKDSQASAWVGQVVADVLGLSGESSAKADRVRINSLLRQWIANGALVVVNRMDPKKREEKPFVEVGEWAVQGVAPPRAGGAGQGGAGRAPTVPHHHLPPVRGGGGAGGAGEGNSGGANRRPILAPGESDNDPIPGWAE